MRRQKISLQLWVFHNVNPKFNNGTLAGVKTSIDDDCAVTGSVAYQFIKDGKFRPFVGLGYGWVNVSDEKSTGALAGTVLRADNSSGLTANVGADYYVNDNFFLRGDVRYLNFDSNITVNGAAVGTANVDPIIYGISAGLAF